MNDSASFGTHLLCGSLRWDMLRPFPRQPAGDRRAGDIILGDLSAYLVEKVNPALIDASGTLPTSLLADLDSLGLLKLCAEPGIGGLGLSAMNAFRVIGVCAIKPAAANGAFGTVALAGPRFVPGCRCSNNGNPEQITSPSAQNRAYRESGPG